MMRKTADKLKEALPAASTRVSLSSLPLIHSTARASLIPSVLIFPPHCCLQSEVWALWLMFLQGILGIQDFTSALGINVKAGSW
jgi:hypothetical protein